MAVSRATSGAGSTFIFIYLVFRLSYGKLIGSAVLGAVERHVGQAQHGLGRLAYLRTLRGHANADLRLAVSPFLVQRAVDSVAARKVSGDSDF